MVDSNFGADGIVRTAIGPGNASAQAVTVQPAGKILAAGFAYNGSNDDFAIARYDRAGHLDPTFGSDGIVLTAIGVRDDQASGIVLQKDGKFGVVGQVYDASIAAVRYDGAGSLDPTFGDGGKIILSSLEGNAISRSVALDAGGRIFIAGKAMNGPTVDIVTVCLTTNGELDSTFDGQTGDANGILLTPVGIGSDQGYGVVFRPMRGHGCICRF